MNFDKHLKHAVLIGVGILVLPACSSHYLVRDPFSGKTYFSRDIDNVGDAGSVRFKDDATGSVVTLPASEVTPISPEEYRRQLKER